MPWEQLCELVKPCYYEGARGNKPYDLELMLRIHLLQNLYDLSDEGTRNEIIDSRAFSDFCEAVLRTGRQDVDRTQTDPEKGYNRGFDHHFCAFFHEKQGKTARFGCPFYVKGNVWYFGYKAHEGVDKDSGLVHTVEVTAANTHDVTMICKLLHGEEETANGNSGGYIGAEKRDDAILRNKNDKKINYNINRRPSQYKKNSKRSQAQIKRREHEKSSVQAKVEYVFAVVKGPL